MRITSVACHRIFMIRRSLMIWKVVSYRNINCWWQENCAISNESWRWFISHRLWHLFVLKVSGWALKPNNRVTARWKLCINYVGILCRMFRLLGSRLRMGADKFFCANSENTINTHTFQIRSSAKRVLLYTCASISLK